MATTSASNSDDSTVDAGHDEGASPPSELFILPDLAATNEERRRMGRAARRRLPRSGAGHWDPSLRSHGALTTILAQNEIRVPDLLPIRHGRMAVSPWNFYRGAAAVMASDLALEPDSGLQVQLCGDAHVLNFGLWATPERNLLFDLRDFDETLPGPFEWDLKRLAASLVVAGRETAAVFGGNGKTAVERAGGQPGHMRRHHHIGQRE